MRGSLIVRRSKAQRLPRTLEALQKMSSLIFCFNSLHYGQDVATRAGYYRVLINNYDSLNHLKVLRESVLLVVMCCNEFEFEFDHRRKFIHFFIHEIEPRCQIVNENRRYACGYLRLRASIENKISRFRVDTISVAKEMYL